MNLDPNDHRSIGQRLDLFHFREEAPGMVFWHPRGVALYRVLEDAVRRECRAQGYAEVRSPQIMRRQVWEASGHWQHFAEGMYRVEMLDEARAVAQAAVKPVNCPGHILIAMRDVISYRDLPLRLCELGVVHRDEPSGSLHGLMRVRQFVQDDGHILCSEQQAPAEIARYCASVFPFYRSFGFAEVEIVLSLRPRERAGDDAQWDRAEQALRAVLAAEELPYSEAPGGGAFYGPKLEIVLADRLGRRWQCGTLQYDLVMPERFDLRYVDSDGQRRRPVMLHRALYGSLERFAGILLEHYGAVLPSWLAPVQAVVLPIAEAQAAAARALGDRLREADLRVEVWSAESLGRRIAYAHALGIVDVLVLGERELARAEVVLRARDGAQRSLALDAALAELRARCTPPHARRASA